jgi:coenzyme PQQ synthesis protein D (PqqD)
MRLLPPLPVPTWDFEINAVPGPSGEGQQGLVVSRSDLPNLFILNHTARFIWRDLQQGGPEEFLVERFASHFGISRTQAAADVGLTLDDWSQGLLSPVRATQYVAPTPSIPPPSSSSFIGDYVLGPKHFRLVVHDHDFVEEIRPRLAHLSANRQPPDTTFHVFRHEDLIWVFCGEASIGAEPDVSVARTILLQEMARLARPDTDWLAILHAAACGTDNRCIILPAATNSGKSTLTAALMHSGLHIFSDDSAAIDRQTHQVVSLPFALMLREGSWPVLAPYFPELDSTPSFYRNGDHVRFLQPPSDRPIGAVAPQCLLFVCYQPGAAAQLRPLTTFESLTGLQKSGFWVPHTRETVAQFLSWVQSLPAYELTYSQLPEAVPLVHSLLEGSC